MEEVSRALFLDRDGVVNREIGYLWRPEQTVFTPGIFDLCQMAQQRQYKLIILTNQSGIARHLYSERDFHSFMHWMTSEFARRQIHLDDYYFCPHHPEHGIGVYRLDCPDRKPRPGMLLRAAHDHHLNLQRSVFIGDRCSDVQAGVSAGIGKMLMINGAESEPCLFPHDSYTKISELSEVLPFLTSFNRG